ncbi:WXG100 family type VII secretion target [Streptosporangium lutulentum]|uniref:WXG100 family type VII secretion target n=1 Tax=Streptosporangium lutulentum TaxID=1461250 RepID=A0ABT9QT10_9ACTN|nr:WXG100 family type VII secretion target [Streptosporangium lutulentum]MDP9849393.1 WXG100 family type VII secretion target [Streptosporangium lutulentum]
MAEPTSGGAGGVDYDGEVIARAAARVLDASQQIEGMRQRVAIHADELLDKGPEGGWKGGAAGKYRIAMERWSQKAASVRMDLERIADNMDLNAKNYNSMTADVDAGMNRVDALINSAIK